MEGSKMMRQKRRQLVYWACGFLPVLWAFQLSGCAKVDQLKTKVADDIAYERANQAIAKDNQAEAAAQYRIAAEAGHAQAQYKLGLMTASGSGVVKNKAEALAWVRRSAAQGYAPAQNLLGSWYYAGSIAPYDPEEAGKWFGKAAVQRDAGAMYFLGMMHARGEGVRKDGDEALRWFRQAAANGFPVPAEYMTPAGVASLAAKTPVPRPAASHATVGRQTLVRQIQAGLAELGYNPGPADGMMGKRTAGAIAAFQKDAGLTTDGEASEKLLQRINARLKK